MALQGQKKKTKCPYKPKEKEVATVLNKRELELPYSDALKRAQVATFTGEELKEENFNRANAEGFEKAVIMLKHWAEMIERAMRENDSFRIEVNYNAEAAKATFAIYTPTTTGKDGSRQEHSDC